MPPSPLTLEAKMPDRLLPMAIDRNQPPMARPGRLAGGSLVVVDGPRGDRHSSPTDWLTETMNRVQNGIFSGCGSPRLDRANISSGKARPLTIRPRPNLRGIDG